MPQHPPSSPATTDGDRATPSPALERLRHQVERAAREIERLQAENRRLRERVATLEQRPAIGADEAFITLDDPEALRRQIDGFIDTIDAYLAERAPTSPSDDSE